MTLSEAKAIVRERHPKADTAFESPEKGVWRYGVSLNGEWPFGDWNDELITAWLNAAKRIQQGRK